MYIRNSEYNDLSYRKLELVVLVAIFSFAARQQKVPWA